MGAYYIGFIFGAVQMILLFVLTGSVSKGNKHLMRLIILIKFTAYVLFLGYVYYKMTSSLILIGCGYITALPLTAIVLYIAMLLYKNYKKKK